MIKINLKALSLKESSNPELVIARRMAFTDSMLFTVGLGLFFNELFLLKINIVIILLIASIYTGMILLFDKTKTKLLTYFILAGILCVLIGVSIVLKINYAAIPSEVYDWYQRYKKSEALYNTKYGFLVMAGILVLSSTVFYPIHRYKGVKNVIASMLLILLIILTVNKIEVPKITVGIIVYYSISVLVELCGKIFCRTNNTINNSLATVYLAPLCIIIAIIAISLPSNPEPFNWNGVKNLIKKVEEQGSLIKTQLGYLFDRTGSEFTIGYTGYSEEENDLGGEVRHKDKISLIVSTQNKSTSKGYLIGSISDIYTGQKWEKSDTSNGLIKEEYYYDFYQLLKVFTIEGKTGSDLNNLIKKRSYNIKYHDIRTRSLFYPLKTVHIDFTKDTRYQENSQGAFLYEKAKGLGTKYEVQYYELNLNSELLQKILREGEILDAVFTENDLENVAKEVFGYNISENEFPIKELEEELSERSQYIKQWYTTLPDTLPNRVRQLAYELTKEFEYDYDKLKAIEIYLNTFTYTTYMDKTPKEEDFVDYFLFEQQRGYCTYFASAMGILARCVNIPTRYVEGFVIDYNNKEYNNTYKVLSNNAHSWVEAYIEGVGWIPFESTPGFYSSRYTTWKESVTEYSSGDSITGNDEPDGMPSNQDRMNDIKIGEMEKSNDTLHKNIVWIVLGSFFLLFVLLIGIIFIYYSFLIKKYKKKFNKASDNLKLTLTMTELLRYLEKEGYKLAKDETLLTYAERIGNKVTFNETNFLYAAKVYMKIRYGEYRVSAEELTVVIEFCKQLKKHLQEKLGKKKMFFDRFLFLHFYQ